MPPVEVGGRSGRAEERLRLLISGMLRACVIKRRVIITLRGSHSELGGIDDDFLQSAQTF